MTVPITVICFGWNDRIQTWFGSIVYPRFLANIFDTEIFVAKITTAITKASGIILDIQEKDGTLIGGSLEMKIKASVSDTAFLTRQR